MKRNVLFNTAIRWSGEIINKLLLLLFFVILARYFGKEDFGYFIYSVAFGSIMATFTDLGTNLFLLKSIVKGKNIGTY